MHQHLVYVLAAFLVISVARTHELVHALLPLRLGKLIGVPMLIACFLYLPAWQLASTLNHSVGRAWVFMAIWMVVSLPFALWPGGSVEYLVSTMAVTLIMWGVTASVLMDRRAAPIVLRVITLAIGIAAARLLMPGALSRTEADGGTLRVEIGFTYDPNETAALFVAAIPLALYLASRPNARRWLWYGVSLVMVAAMVRTGSRGGMLALVTVAGILIALAPPRRRLTFLSAAFAAPVVFAIVASSDPALRARFASTFSSGEDYNYTSQEGRLEVWRRGVTYMITHPVFGVGVDGFSVAELEIGPELKKRRASGGVVLTRTQAAHNSLVQIGAELGFPGLIAWGFSIAAALWGVARARARAVGATRRGVPGLQDESALASAALCSLVGVVITSMFLSLAYSPITMFVLALCVGVAAGSPYAAAIPGRTVGRATGQQPSFVPGRRGGLNRAQPGVAGAYRSLRPGA